MSAPTQTLTDPESRVLLVTDGPADLTALEAALGGPGRRLVRVRSAEEALRQLADGGFAVAVLDLQTLGPDALRAAKLIRSTERSRHTPIIFLTGDGADLFLAEAYELGAVDHLARPVVPQILRAKVANFVRRPDAGQRPAGSARGEHLRASEELFRSAFEDTNVAMVLTDASHRFVRVNEAFARLFGYPQQEMLGLAMAEVTHPADVAESYARRVPLESGESDYFQMEKRYLHKDSHVFWGLANVSVVRDAEGRPLLYVGQVQDVTERRRAEEANARAAERLRILNQMDRALVAGEGPAEIAGAALAPLRELLGVPRAIVNLFDLANGEVEWLAAAGRKRVRVGPGVRYSIRLMGDVEALRRGEPQSIDVHALPPGPEVDALLASGVHAYAVVPMIAGGELIGAISFGGELLPSSAEQLAVAREAAAQFAIALAQARLYEQVKRQARELEARVAERERAEEALRREREFVRLVLDTDPNLIFVKDADGRFVLVNQALAELYATTPEALVGRRPGEDLAAPQEAAEYRRAELEVLRTGKPVVADESNTRPDGRAFWFHTVKVPLPLPDGSTGVLGIAADVTQRKRAEEELREAGRRKDAFLAMLAHELRAPLATLTPALAALRQGGAESQLRGRLVELMERQARHLRRLVDDLLEASHFVHGKVQLAPERLDLARLARRAAEDRRPALSQAGLALEVQAPPTPVWVHGDAVRLAQAVGNLLDNAARYSDPGGRVTLSVAADAGAGRAVLVVADTGVGIPPEVLPRLFKPFEQAEQGPDRRRGGLGLGLSVVRSVAELHGGTAEAHSDGPGRGATFSVRLPLEPEPGALAEVPARPPAARGGRHRILVVEDNADAADSLRVLLEVLGHEVRVAHTGPDGVSAAGDWLPEVVLSDVGLPGFDGWEVARRVRLLPGMEAALLVALTGYGSEDDKRRSREAGFHHHLVKPAEPADLQRALAAVVA
jgi:PAS domain S-box-containing protein